MAFLAVLLSYLLSRYTTLCRVIQRDGWFHALLLALPRELSFYVAVPGMALLAALCLWQLSFWSAWLLGLLLLLYSLGRGDWRSELPQAVAQLRDGKSEAVWLALESDGFTGGTGEPAEQLWRALCRRAAWRHLDDLFAVFFWFMVAGPLGSAGALLFRLACLHHNSGAVPAMPGWRLFLEWLPARYMALCVCLAGNFAGAFPVWRRLALDTHQPTLDFLARCLDEALVIEEGSSSVDAVDAVARQAMVRMQALQDLLARTEIIGLVGLAAAVLLMG